MPAGAFFTVIGKKEVSAVMNTFNFSTEAF